MSDAQIARTLGDLALELMAKGDNRAVVLADLALRFEPDPLPELAAGLASRRVPDALALRVVDGGRT